MRSTFRVVMFQLAGSSYRLLLLCDPRRQNVCFNKLLQIIRKLPPHTVSEDWKTLPNRILALPAEVTLLAPTFHHMGVPKFQAPKHRA